MDRGNGAAAGRSTLSWRMSSRWRQRRLRATSVAAAAARRVSRIGRMARTLAQSRLTIWDLMQRRVAVILGAAPVDAFSMEQFLDVVAGTQRFIAVGESFAGSDSAAAVRSTIQSKSHALFMRFHGERLDELRMRLETEVWQPLPLQRGWRMTQITEARPARRGPRLRVYSLLASLSAAADADGATLGTAVGGAPMHEQWPAAFPPGYGAAAACFAALDAGVVKVRPGAALEQPDGAAGAGGEDMCGVDGGGAGAGSGDDGERDGGGLGSPATLCGVGLQVARFSATYVRIMRELPAVAAEVLRGLQGLLDLCMFTVYSIFTPGAKVRDAASLPLNAETRPPAFWRSPAPHRPQLRSTAQCRANTRTRLPAHAPRQVGSVEFASNAERVPARLHGSLTAIHSRCYGESGAEDGGGELAAELRRVIATISVDRLREPLEAQPLFALAPTVVGMESLRLLGEALDSLASRLREAPLDHVSKELLARCLEQPAAQLPALCAHVYRGVARGMIDLEPVVSAIRNRSWALREIGTQHSMYVDQVPAPLGTARPCALQRPHQPRAPAPTSRVRCRSCSR